MVSGYAQKFKKAEPSDNLCSSEDDEYSDPLEVAARAGARKVLQKKPVSLGKEKCRLIQPKR